MSKNKDRESAGKFFLLGFVSAAFFFTVLGVAHFPEALDRRVRERLAEYDIPNPPAN